LGEGGRAAPVQNNPHIKDGCLLGCLHHTAMSSPWHRPHDGGSKDFETSVNLSQPTRRYDPEDSHIHTHRRENVKCNPHITCRCDKVEPLCLFKHHVLKTYGGVKVQLHALTSARGERSTSF
jgi:hypothetical protein